jgi:hypothetical protein
MQLQSKLLFFFFFCKIRFYFFLPIITVGWFQSADGKFTKKKTKQKQKSKCGKRIRREGGVKSIHERRKKERKRK